MSTSKTRASGRFVRAALLALVAAALLIPLVATVRDARGASAAQATPAAETAPDSATAGALARRCGRRVAVVGAVEARLDAALADLVAQDILTEEQAAAVKERLAAPQDGTAATGAATPATGDAASGHGLLGPCARLLRVQDLVETVAAIVGVEPAELVARYAAGESLAEIAEDEGVTRDELIAALEAEIDARLDAAVAAGLIDEDERVAIEARLTGRLDEIVDRHHPSPGHDAHHPNGTPGVDATPQATA